MDKRLIIFGCLLLLLSSFAYSFDLGARDYYSNASINTFSSHLYSNSPLYVLDAFEYYWSFLGSTEGSIGDLDFLTYNTSFTWNIQDNYNDVNTSLNRNIFVPFNNSKEDYKERVTTNISGGWFVNGSRYDRGYYFNDSGYLNFSESLLTKFEYPMVPVDLSPEHLPAHQGVVFNDDYNFLIHTPNVTKYDNNYNLNDSYTGSLPSGTNHYGGGFIVGDILYVTVERWGACAGEDYDTQRVRAFNITDMSVIEDIDISDINQEVSGMSYHPEDNYVLVTSYCNKTLIQNRSFPDFTFNGYVTLDTETDQVQDVCINYDEDTMYLTSAAYQEIKKFYVNGTFIENAGKTYQWGNEGCDWHNDTLKMLQDDSWGDAQVITYRESNGITVKMWVNTTVNASATKTAFMKFFSTVNDELSWFYRQSSGELELKFTTPSDPAWPRPVVPNSYLKVNDYMLIGFRYNYTTGNLAVFVDGVKVDEDTYSGDYIQNDGLYEIGSHVLHGLVNTTVVNFEFLSEAKEDDWWANYGTCFDGIQNGDETGEDCGGDYCLACNIKHSGYEFDGKVNSSQMNVSNSEMNFTNDDIWVHAQVKFNELSSFDNIYVVDREWGHGAGYFWRLYKHSNNMVYFTIYNQSGQECFIGQTISDLDHVYDIFAGIRENNELFMYIDGVEQNDRLESCPATGADFASDWLDNIYVGWEYVSFANMTLMSVGHGNIPPENMSYDDFAEYLFSKQYFYDKEKSTTTGKVTYDVENASLNTLVSKTNYYTSSYLLWDINAFLNATLTNYFYVHNYSYSGYQTFNNINYTMYLGYQLNMSCRNGSGTYVALLLDDTVVQNESVSCYDLPHIYDFNYTHDVFEGFNVSIYITSEDTDYQFAYSHFNWSYGVDDCSSFNYTTLVLNIYNEEYPTTPLNASLEIESIIWFDSKDNSQTSYFDLSGNWTYSLCLLNPEAVFYSDMYIKYTTDNGFTHRYYLVNHSLSNESEEINMYNFNHTDGVSDLKLIVRNYNTYQYFPNVITKLQRRYLDEGVWRTVQMDESGDFGLVFFNIIEENTDYRLLFYDRSNNLLKTTESMKFICTDGVCELTTTVSAYSIPTTEEEIDVDISFDNSTKIITITWSDPDAETKTVTAKVTKETITGTVDICEETQTGAAGAFTCNASSYSGDLLVDISTTNSYAQKEWVNVANQKLGSVVNALEATVWTFAIIVTVVMFGVFIGAVATIIATLIGLIIVYFIGIFNPLTLTFIIIAAAIGIAIGIKLRN